MAQTSFALMTTLGRAKEAAALANATTIEITHIAIGDGTTVPSGGETALYHEVARKTISGHGTVVGATNVAYFDAFLAAEDGPYTIREAGLIDDDGDLIAIAKYDPPISKPVPASGQTVEGTVRLEVAFSDVANITIKVDPAMQVALQRLTRMPYIAISGYAVNTPPASPTIGDCYVIGGSPTGPWAGHAGKIAEYTAAGWAIMVPPNGHVVGLADGTEYKRVGGIYLLRGKIKSAIEAAGLVLSHSNQSQLAEAMTRTASGGVFYTDTGAANAYVLAQIGTFVPPSAYFDGMEVVFFAGHANTGACTIKVGSLAAVPFVESDGTALAAGRIDGSLVTARYRASASKFFMQPWSRAANPPFLLVNHTVNYSAPHDTVFDLQYNDVVGNTLGGGWDGKTFTAPRDGTYLVNYRSSVKNGVNTDIVSTISSIDASLAPGSPYGAFSGLWTYANYSNGTYQITAPVISGASVISLAKNDKIKLQGRFKSSVSGARDINAGKLAIILVA